MELINVCFSSVLLAAISTAWFIFIRRLVRSNASGKRWSARRLKAVHFTIAECSLQLVNTIFFLLPNAYILGTNCGWFDHVVQWSGWVRWTCWNSLFLLFWMQVSRAGYALCFNTSGCPIERGVHSDCFPLVAWGHGS